MNFRFITFIVVFVNIHLSRLAYTLFDSYSPEYGFSSFQGTLGTNSCFIPDKIIYNGIIKKSLNPFYTYNELIESLSLLNDITLPSYIFPNNQLAQYLKSIKPTELTYSFNFLISQFQEVKLIYDTSVPEAFIKDHAFKTLSKSPNDFNAKCGDEIVDSYDLGTLFLTSFNLLFHTVEEQKQFIMSLNPTLKKISYENIMETISTIIKNDNVKGTIELSSFQNGGNETIINYQEVTSCLFSTIEKCKTKYDETRKYVVLFNTQFEKYPLYRKPLTRYHKVLLSDISQHCVKPMYTVSENVSKIQKTILQTYNKYSYYDRFLSNFQYYPVEINSIINCLSKVKENLKKITSSNPIKCFEDNSVCGNYETILNSLDTNIEDKIVSLIERVKTYDIITIYLREDLFLNGEGTGNLPKFQWDAEYPVYIYILPVDNNVFKWKIESEVFEVDYSSDIITDLNKIEFNVDEGFFKFKITLLRNHKNENEFKVIVNEEEKKIIKQIKIPLINQANPFYFTKYNETNI